MRRSAWVRRGLAAAALLALLVVGVRRPAPNTAALVRDVPVGAQPAALAVAPRSRRVFVVNGSGDSVSVLDTHAGALLRTTAVGRAPQGLAVDEDTERVFVSNSSGNTVSVLDARTGRLVGTVDVGICPSVVAVSARSGRVFVLNYDTHRTISMLDARSGAFLRVVDPPGSNLGAFLPDANADDPAQRIFVMSNDQVTGQPSVVVLDAASGRLRGIIRLAQGDTPLAVDTRRNRLVIGTARGVVWVLTATTGRLVRRVQLGAEPAATVVDAAHGRIILVDETTNTVTILDEVSGARLHSISVPGATGPVTIDPRTGRILVVGTSRTAAGRISVLDAARGRIVDTVTVGQTPVALAVDAPTGRVFVVNQLGVGPVQQSGWEAAVQRLRHWLPWLPQPTARPSSGFGSVSVVARR